MRIQMLNIQMCIHLHLLTGLLSSSRNMQVGLIKEYIFVDIKLLIS